MWDIWSELAKASYTWYDNDACTECRNWKFISHAFKVSSPECSVHALSTCYSATGNFMGIKLMIAAIDLPPNSVEEFSSTPVTSCLQG